MATAAEEVAALDRVLTRLALTNEDNLEKVLERLVPAVINQLKSPHDATRKKVLEMLSHVNKRLQGHNSIKLPLKALLDLYLNQESSSMTRNFALVYVETAFQRSSTEERFSVVDKLLQGVSGRHPQHRDILLRLAAQALENLSVTSPSLGTEEQFRARYTFLDNAEDILLFLDFALRVLLYQPPSKGRERATPLSLGLQHLPVTATAEERSSLSANALGADAADRRPGGLSKADVAQVTGKTAPEGQVLASRKLGLLNFLVASGTKADDTLLHFIVAACDPDDAVCRRGEELLRKRCGMDSAKPSVDLENAKLIHRLFLLFQGTSKRSSVPEPNQISPATPAVQARLMSIFTKSVAAANCFPQTFEAIFQCIYGQGTTVRLKQAGMEFAVWAFKHAAADQLQQAAPDILKALLGLLDDAGDAFGSDAAAVTLRGFTYQAVGQLGQRAPKVLRAEVDVPVRFFHTLAIEAPGVRASLQEALSALATAYKGISGSALEDIRKLLLRGIKSSSEGVRFCGVQWATKIFPFHDVTARYICILAAADNKLEVREMGLNGLKKESFMKPGEAAAEDFKFPALADMVSFLRSKHARLGRAPEPGERLLLEPKAFLALIDFLGRCRAQELKSRSAVIGEEDYQDLLEHALIRDGTSELHVAALQAFLETASTAPDSFAMRYSSRVSLFRNFLGHVNDQARNLASKLLGVVACRLPSSEASELLQQLCSTFPAKTDTQPNKFEERSGSLVAAGYVLAQCLTGSPQVEPTLVEGVQRQMGRALNDADLSLGAAAASGLGIAGLRQPLQLPLGTIEVPLAEQSISATESATHTPLETQIKERIAEGTSSSGAAVESRLAVVKAISAIASDKDVKAASRAATAIGYIAAGDRAPPVLDGALKALLDLAGKKGDELQFAVGEAFCFAYGGLRVTADEILRGNFRTLSSELLSSNDAKSVEDPDAMQIDQGTGVAPSTSDDPPADPAQAAFQDKILASILDEYIYHSRTEVRSAACIWLVSIISFTTQSPVLLKRLTEIQEALGHLLGDSCELIQEMASRGISAVYRLGGEEDRKALVTALMSTLQGGARKRRAVKITGDTRVFEEGQLGEAPGGGSLSTYKELCSLATDMGQPDLLYKFMDLANHAAALNSSRGAAFGVASIAKLAGNQMEPYVAQLVPKLYRYQYDPNPRVRDGMTNIWRVLVSEPRKAVDQHFGAIMTELLKEMGGRLWRSREAASLAMADLLQGRRWHDVETHLEKIWTMALRALDDIKESVRTAAGSLVRTLRGLTLRLTDPSQSPEQQASAALSVALPFLLKTGTTSSVVEVRNVALTTISKMVQLAKPAQIQAHLPDVTAAMLESLSAMEDSRINYVEQHADSLGLDAEKLENLRVSASKSSPMGDTLDLCARYTNAETLETLVPRLTQLVRRGVGLNTRVGTSRFIASLTMRLGRDTRAHAGALIKALIGAAKNEHSAAVRRSYASTAAQVAKYAPEARVAALAQEAVEMYGDPGDAASRQLAGLITRELARQAHDAFAAQAGQIMPLAFVATSDEDPGVASLWQDVWSEESSSESALLRLYMSEILVLLQKNLSSQQWERKIAAAKAISALCLSGGDSLPQYANPIAAALLKELPGRIWEGKESILQAIAAVCKAAPQQFDGKGASPSASEIVDAAVGAVSRPKSSYRNAALQSLEVILRSLTGDFYAMVAPVLLEAVEEAQKGHDKSKEDIEGEMKPLPLLETLKALAAAWNGCSGSTSEQWGPKHANALSLCLKSGHHWTIRAASLMAAKDFVTVLLGLHSSEEIGSLGNADLPLVESLIPGVLAAFEEQRISQIRGASLDCLSAAIEATKEGSLLEVATTQNIRQSLAAFISAEKNAGLLAQAQRLADRLSLTPMIID